MTDDGYDGMLDLLRAGETGLAPVVEEMARDRGDAPIRLLAIAYDEPGPDAWDRFVEAVDELDDGQNLPEEALAALDGWPDEQRSAPAAWWNSLQRGEARHRPHWPAVRALIAQGFDHGYDLCADAGHLAALRWLTTDSDTVAIGQVGAATELRHLDYQFAPGAEHHDLEPLRGTADLHSLTLRIAEPVDLAVIGGMSGLRRLSLELAPGTGEPPDLDPLAGLANLQSLALSRAGARLPILDALSALPALDTLRLERPPPDLAPVAAMPALADLTVVRADDWPDAAGFRLPATLRQLRIVTSPQLERLHGVEGLHGLETVEIIEAGRLRSVDELRAAPALASLLLDGTALETLRDLEDFASLIELSLFRQPELEALTIGGAHAAIRVLRIVSAPRLAAIDAVEHMPALTTLALRDLPMLTTLEPLAGLEHLEAVAIEGCPALEDAGALTQLPALRRVELFGSPRARGYEALTARPDVELATGP